MPPSSWGVFGNGPTTKILGWVSFSLRSRSSSDYFYSSCLLLEKNLISVHVILLESKVRNS